ncbi:hypothetical protein [Haloarchaeobius sp. DT45]|uniref:hypothetical protein n=1 Tax=Haloarchaeobius sp. DT45 TaxID=3446116 RepID=UPI003F6C958D
MSDGSHRRLALLLLVVTGLLISLAPWGPIETRSFAHLSPAVYWGFNGFLVALGMASFATAAALWRGRSGAVPAAIGVAACYIVVYLLDLFAVFPTSPDPMPPLLFTVELVDTALAAILVGYAAVVRRKTSELSGSAPGRVH